MRYRFGHFQFDARNATLEGPQGPIPLRPMSLKLLHALLDAAPDLVAHEQLLDRIWGRQAVTPGVVSQSIRELRRALDDSAQAPLWIETRHKLGYRFCGPLERLPDETNIPASEPSPATGEERTPSSPPAAAARRKLWPIVFAVVAGIMLAVGILLWRGAPSVSGAREHPAEIVSDGRPQEPEALSWYRQGLDALAGHDPVQAQEHFERALQREPASIAALAGLAQALAERGETQRARELAAPLHDGIATLPRDSQLRIAAFLAQLEHQNADALRHLTALTALNPGDADAGLRLAELQISSGLSADAETTLTRVETLPRVPHHRLALLRARIAGVRGDHSARLAAAQEAAGAPSTSPLHAEALLEQGHAHLLAGQPAAASTLLEQLTALPGIAAWPAISLRTGLLAGALLRHAGKLPEAIQSFEQTSTSAQQAGLPALASLAQREAAYAQFIAGRYDEALTRLETAQEQQTHLGDPALLAGTLGVAALVHQRRGNHPAAQELLQRMLALHLETGDLAGQATARNSLGMLFSRTGRHEESQQQWDAALALFERIGNRRGVATARSNLAIAHGHAGRTVAAREANETALETFRDIGATADVARLQFNLGIQDRRAGQLPQAEARLREALAGFTTIGAESFRLQATATLAELLLMRADIAAADALLAELDPATLSPPERAAAIVSAQARLAMLRGDIESAAAGFTQARTLRETSGQADWVRFSELDLAELAALQGELTIAGQRAQELRRGMAEHGDARAALHAGLLLAAIRHARGEHAASDRLLDTLEQELAAQPDALLAQRLDLIRAAQNLTDRRNALSHYAQRARSAGFELLALRAELLGGDEAHARQRLAELGIQMQGMPPALPY
ncbi:tetratricopeptide repeat protein [Xanthomonadaceae bacterium JHOS43]|nr:tetratricopeptide repeat protein [Xanthomonadaceae bacterium JHOS43]